LAGLGQESLASHPPARFEPFDHTVDDCTPHGTGVGDGHAMARNYLTKTSKSIPVFKFSFVLDLNKRVSSREWGS
jgi:hypothetical protein